MLKLEHSTTEESCMKYFKKWATLSLPLIIVVTPIRQNCSDPLKLPWLKMQIQHLIGSAKIHILGPTLLYGDTGNSESQIKDIHKRKNKNEIIKKIKNKKTRQIYPKNVECHAALCNLEKKFREINLTFF